MSEVGNETPGTPDAPASPMTDDGQHAEPTAPDDVDWDAYNRLGCEPDLTPGLGMHSRPTTVAESARLADLIDRTPRAADLAWEGLPEPDGPPISEPWPGLSEAASRPGLVRMSDVRAERVSWLWQGRIPMGKVTVVDGDPGQGKSTMTLDIAARVSRGLPMPDGSKGVSPAAVLVLSAEDDPADTIRPRLEAAGADLGRVMALSEVDGRLPDLSRDIALIQEVVVAHMVALVVIDPLMAYLGGDVNGHRDQDVRRALAPLAMMAQRTGATVVLVRHLNKQSGGSAIYRGGGSIGITGAARSVLLVATDPNADPSDPSPRRIVAGVKSNLAAMAPSMAYRLVTDEATGMGRVVWEEGTVCISADDLTRIRDREDGHGAGGDAVDFLRAMLAEGPVPASDLIRQARQEGISERTLRRARDRAGVQSRRQGFGKGSVVWWSLPMDGRTDGRMTPQDAQDPTRCSAPEGDGHPVEGMSALWEVEDALSDVPRWS